MVLFILKHNNMQKAYIMLLLIKSNVLGLPKLKLLNSVQYIA